MDVNMVQQSGDFRLGQMPRTQLVDKRSPNMTQWNNEYVQLREGQKKGKSFELDRSEVLRSQSGYLLGHRRPLRQEKTYSSPFEKSRIPFHSSSFNQSYNFSRSFNQSSSGRLGKQQPVVAQIPQHQRKVQGYAPRVSGYMRNTLQTRVNLVNSYLKEKEEEMRKVQKQNDPFWIVETADQDDSSNGSVDDGPLTC
eukprot:TRINITY_DN6413_c0_g1_i1.p1 TRINITY_DN6413_c0_g1~~TRINITY_DN6413_c0_g1_i1.p1  ORF type:complete len:196 (+),score=9.96 TRINITY_DN6413_c0_g1_i1:131-718(+)